MFLAKEVLGIEICQNGLRIAVLERERGGEPRLCAAGVDSFAPDTMKLSQREQNVINTAVFVSKLRETHLKLMSRSSRVSVSLPDSVGRVMLLDLETRFRSRDEGADIIRWKLKKSFPVDINDIHLDYQVLRSKETGEIATLVSLISKSVVNQYEELFLEAGLEPARIGFSSFSLYRLFAKRLDLADNALLFTYFGRTVGVLALKEGVIDFCRSKEIRTPVFEPERVYREITGSLLAYRERSQSHYPFSIFCASAGAAANDFRALVTEATGEEPIALSAADFISVREDLVCEKSLLDLLAASVGAALGFL
jgi:type IV pilus assembly protein PilM